MHEDDALMLRFQEHRDPDVFAELMNRQSETVRRALRQQLRGGDQDIVDELYQRVVLRILERSHTFVIPVPFRRYPLPPPPPPYVAGWLYAIARNIAFDYLRKEARPKVAYVGDLWDLDEKTSPVSDLPEPSESVTYSEMIQDLHATMDRCLTVDEQHVLTLRFLSGNTTQEISEQLGLPLSTVYRRTYNALAKMRHAYGGEPFPLRGTDEPRRRPVLTPTARRSLSMLGSGPWVEIADRLCAALLRSQSRELTLPDLVAMTNVVPFTLTDLHVVLELLTYSSEPVVERVFRYRNSDRTVPPDQIEEFFVHGIDSQTWREWSHQVRVSWKLV